MEHAIILYDSDCGFCRWSLSKILRWDRRARLLPVPLQDPRADTLLDGMDAERKMASWHLVTPEGRIRSAGAAVAPLLRLLPGGRPLAAVASTFPRTTERAYRWAARNRDRLGRTVGSQACAVNPTALRPGTDQPD
jgi:predicted DCC family thiol-disulfide oxidoreductase YuxK